MGKDKCSTERQYLLTKELNKIEGSECRSENVHDNCDAEKDESDRDETKGVCLCVLGCVFVALSAVCVKELKAKILDQQVRYD